MIGKKSVTVIFIASFFRCFSSGIWRFLYPIFIEKEISVEHIGIITSVAISISLLLSFLAGILIDRTKKYKLIVIISGYIGSVSILFMKEIYNEYIFALSFLFSCISTSVMTVAFIVIIGIISENKKKSMNLGILGATSGVGMVLGSYLGGFLLEKIPFVYIFQLSAGLFFLSTFCIHFFLKPPMESKEGYEKRSPVKTIPSLKLLLQNKIYISYFLFFSLYTFLDMFIFPAIWTLYAKSTLNFSADRIGLMVGVEQAGLCLFSFIAGFIITKKNNRNIALMSMAGLSLSSIMYIYSYSEIFFYISGFLIGCSTGFYYTATYSFISKVVPKSSYGTAIGLLSLSDSVSALFAPFLGSLLWSKLGPKFPFLFYGITSLILIILYSFYINYFEVEFE
ncbi:MAG: MFS transporter [archaeon]|nr:MFS transporter [archaeon]